MNNLSYVYSKLSGIRKSLNSPTEIEIYQRGTKKYKAVKVYPIEAKEYFDKYNKYLAQLKEKIPNLYDEFLERSLQKESGWDNFLSHEQMAVLRMDLDNIFEIKEAHEILVNQPINIIELAEINLERIFKKFHKVALELRDRYSDKSTITLVNEYDVQDLLRGLLRLYFDDIRPEEYSPSNSGSTSRIDFLLKEEKIGIEVKMTNENLKDKQLGEQILIDIGRYQEHPDCSKLFVFIYDKNDYIKNKRGLIRDIEKNSSNEFPIRVYICPD